MENITLAGSNIMEFLQQNDQSYQVYHQFVHLQDGRKQTSVVTFIYVHISLVTEDVFAREELQKILLGENRDEACSGGYAVTFRVFDSRVRIVNFQLTHGLNAQKQRIADLKELLKSLGRSKPCDHTFLLGDFAATNVQEIEDPQLRNFVNVYNSIPEWNHDRFKFLLQDFDEVATNLKTKVEDFGNFEELEIVFPPTNHRLPNRIEAPSKRTLGELFHPSFDLEMLFSYDNDLPCYPDRIFYKTMQVELESCLKPGKTGTCEGVTLNDRVPVFSTFRIGSKILGLTLEPQTAEELNEIRKHYKPSTVNLNSTKLEKLKNDLRRNSCLRVNDSQEKKEPQQDISSSQDAVSKLNLASSTLEQEQPNNKNAKAVLYCMGTKIGVT